MSVFLTVLDVSVNAYTASVGFRPGRVLNNELVLVPKKTIAYLPGRQCGLAVCRKEGFW